MIKVYIISLIIGFFISALSFAGTPESRRTPENQVFQFMQSGTCTAWADSTKTNAKLYLWIPEKCIKLKGLLIMCNNVPEHMLVGHRFIRKVCAENDLGIIWSTPSFMNFRKSKTKDDKMINMALEHKTTVEFLQKMLQGLAKTSGYAEVATVPWLPMGESGHLLMVDALLEFCPERCIAGVYIKNNHLPPTNRATPTLVVYGTAQEWSQDKSDIRTKWNDVGDAYAKILQERKQHPTWPLSYVIDGSSGHFDCSEKITKYLASYIELVVQSRLPVDDSNTLKPINLAKGYLANMPIKGQNKNLTTALIASDEQKTYPWFFDKKNAREAQKFANINWEAATQLPAFKIDSTTIAPFKFNGISLIEPLLVTDDGIRFGIQPVLLNHIPANFSTGAGEKLAKVKKQPELEWVCGQYKPVGKNYFQISLDRMYPNTTSYIGVRSDGNKDVRAVFQPGGLRLPKNTDGKNQIISFEMIKEIRVGVKSVQLVANSNSGLPVSFYVVSGPAIIKNNKLVFTKIPPRTKFPIEITVAAWQWGRHKEPKIKTAEVVLQKLNIIQ